MDGCLTDERKRGKQKRPRDVEREREVSIRKFDAVHLCSKS